MLTGDAGRMGSQLQNMRSIGETRTKLPTPNVSAQNNLGVVRTLRSAVLALDTYKSSTVLSGSDLVRIPPCRSLIELRQDFDMGGYEPKTRTAWNRQVSYIERQHGAP